MSRDRNYRRRARRLPNPTGPSGQRFGITITEYMVGSWCPTPDGSGPAEAVALQIMTAHPQISSLVMRLKSPAAVDEMVAALRRHQRDVWPDHEPQEDLEAGGEPCDPPQTE